MKQNVDNIKKNQNLKTKTSIQKNPNKTKTNNCKTCAFHLLP